MPEHARAEDRVELVDDVIEQVRLHQADQALHQEEDDHAPADDHQRRHALVADNFVDDDLRDERHPDPHQLQEKCPDEHLEQRFFISLEHHEEEVEIILLLDEIPAH